MASAPARQPRTGSASPRARHPALVGIGLIGAALLASLVLRSPFAGSHLLPSRIPAATISHAPAAAARAAALPSRAGQAAAPRAAAPAPNAPANTNTMSAGMPPPIPTTAMPAAPPVRPLVAPPPATPERPVAESQSPAPTEQRPAVAASGVRPVFDSGAPLVGAPPPARAPLPLETTLIGPAMPAAPAAGRIDPAPDGSAAPAIGPTPTDPRG